MISPLFFMVAVSFTSKPSRFPKFVMQIMLPWVSLPIIRSCIPEIIFGVAEGVGALVELGTGERYGVAVDVTLVAGWHADNRKTKTRNQIEFFISALSSISLSLSPSQP